MWSRLSAWVNHRPEAGATKPYLRGTARRAPTLKEKPYFFPFLGGLPASTLHMVPDSPQALHFLGLQRVSTLLPHFSQVKTAIALPPIDRVQSSRFKVNCAAWNAPYIRAPSSSFLLFPFYPFTLLPFSPLPPAFMGREGNLQGLVQSLHRVEGKFLAHRGWDLLQVHLVLGRQDNFLDAGPVRRPGPCF